MTCCLQLTLSWMYSIHPWIPLKEKDSSCSLFPDCYATSPERPGNTRARPSETLRQRITTEREFTPLSQLCSCIFVFLKHTMNLQRPKQTNEDEPENKKDTSGDGLLIGLRLQVCPHFSRNSRGSQDMQAVCKSARSTQEGLIQF